MFGSKPAASLSSGLLARKGQARPAMRPQGFVNLSQIPVHEDLGWNDMGEDHPPAPSLAPVPSSPPPVPAPVPPVLRQRDELAEALTPPQVQPQPLAEPQAEVPETVEPEAAPIAETPVAPVAEPAPVKRAARDLGVAKGKAAFTLRLDPDRHLRLRLASAVSHRSAQQLVCEALDRFLESLPEVEAMASRLPARDDRR